MTFLVKLIELICFLTLTLLGALVVGLGMAIACPGIVVRWLGEWIVDFASRFE